MYACHFNEEQWQKPHEFLPERFDHSNQLSLTPSGKKRSPYALIPFSGGRRTCAGKTFAEAVLKTTAALLT